MFRVTDFGDAAYLVLSSRLIPDLDGGFTVATLARARLLAEAGADVRILTIDPAAPADHARHRAEFVRRGVLDDARRMRNLFDEGADPAGGAAAWLVDAGRPGNAPDEPHSRPVQDAEGRAVLDLPVIVGDPDWHLSTASVVLWDAAGRVAGVLDGFGALYRAWLDHVVAGIRGQDPDRDVVVVCESRQLGELIVGWGDPGIRIVHTIHTTHLDAPYTPDAPVNALWERWFAVADRFDAVLWPTAAQRDDVVARFGLRGRHLVVPHAAPLRTPNGIHPIPGRAVMLNRLAPGKRVDHAIRAVAAVHDATLDIFGEGPERDALQHLIVALGVTDRVHLRGATASPGAEIDAASVLVSTSAFEGQGLAIAEALAHGCPVVAYDIRYGPHDMLRDGGGALVPDGDVPALSDALADVLADPDLRSRLAAEAVASAAHRTPEVVTALLAAALRP